VYCWHGLPAYWGGVMPGTPSLSGLTGSSLVYPKPTNSIAEVEPSLMWSPAVLAGAQGKNEVCVVFQVLVRAVQVLSLFMWSPAVLAGA
jgi:hypothetical protein